MSKRDDVKILYNYTKIARKFLIGLFVINVILSIIILIFNNTGIVFHLIRIQIIVLIIFVCLNLLDDNILLISAESTRRKTLVENGLDINMTEYKTDEYYNNSFKPSLIKLELNVFESIYFSKNIVLSMLKKEIAKTIIAFILFIFACIYYVNGNYLLLIVQILFSYYLFIITVGFIIYSIKLQKLYSIFYTQFITIGISSIDQVNALLTSVLEYEAIKAHYKIRLSQKEFNKQNTKLKNDWNILLESTKILID